MDREEDAFKFGLFLGLLLGALSLLFILLISTTKRDYYYTDLDSQIVRVRAKYCQEITVDDNPYLACYLPEDGENIEVYSAIDILE